MFEVGDGCCEVFGVVWEGGGECVDCGGDFFDEGGCLVFGC